MSGLNRRSFLTASAAAIAAPSLVRAQTMADVDVVVIGAGAAGISAARRISAAGRRLALLEAMGRLGGRC
ncbi:MAG: NAD(P)-binding protein, partial [Pseudolabrys sp.]